MTRGFKTLVLALAVASMATAGPAEAAPGTIDPTFGYRGTAVVDFPGEDYAWKVALQRDGKIVLAGYANDSLGVVRLTANGHPDPTFSGDGRTTIPLGTYEFPIGVATMSDGSIILGTYVEDLRSYTDSPVVDAWAQWAVDGAWFALIKLRRDGSLDPSFGRGGIAFSHSKVARPLDDVGVHLASTPAGQIVVLAVRGFNAGYYGYPSGGVVMRFTRDGKMDPTFGVAGTVPAPYAGALPDPSGLAVLSNGRILVAWSVHERGFATFSESDLVHARYLPSGALDSSFGTGGVARPDAMGRPEGAWGIKLAPDGKILVFGQNYGPGRFTAAVMRLHRGGSVDTGFGNGGVATLAIGPSSNFRGVDVQSDGSIVAAVNAYGTNGVARFRPNGSLDRAFGSGGYRQIPFAILSEVAVQPSRVIAVGGHTSVPNGFATIGLTR